MIGVKLPLQENNKADISIVSCSSKWSLRVYTTSRLLRLKMLKKRVLQSSPNVGVEASHQLARAERVSKILKSSLRSPAIFLTRFGHFQRFTPLFPVQIEKHSVKLALFWFPGAFDSLPSGVLLYPLVFRWTGIGDRQQPFSGLHGHSNWVSSD